MKVTTDSCLFGAWVARDIGRINISKNVLDIGSGSGLLSLMVAQETLAKIDGIELQAADAYQAIQNITASPFCSRIQIYNADAISFEYNKKYDIVISNPPFYQTDLKSHQKEKNIAHHDEGLKLNDLILLIESILDSQGFFYLLLPVKRQQDIEDIIAKSTLGINDMVLVRQTETHAPFRVMLKGSFQKTKITYTDIAIKKDNAYTHAFMKLLQPYYLHL